MKTHTQTFKQNLIKLGKEINAKITYTINGTTTELDGESLASVTPHFKGSILKSVMKQVDIESDIDIPIGTQINVQFGMKYDDEEYEYIDYGNYIIYSSEKQEDTNNYRIIAYDKMLYSMKDYEKLNSINLIDTSDLIEGKYYSATQIGSSSNWKIAQIKVQPNTTYYISGNNYINNLPYFVFLDKDKNRIGNIGKYNDIHEFITTSETAYVGISIADYHGTADLNTIQLEQNDTASPYQPYGDIQYPISVKNFIKAIATRLNLSLATQSFVNQDRIIDSEKYLDNQGKSMAYTYRDVLDQLAEVTASTICINKDDKLEVRYLNDTQGKNLVKNYVVDSILTQYRQVLWADFDIQPNTKYTISFEGTPGNKIYLNEVLFNQVNVEIQEGRTIVSSTSKSTINSNQYITDKGWIIFKNYPPGVSKPNVFNNLMIQEGWSSSNYEPYGDTINEDYIKNTRVDFGEKYGPVNSIVLSRSADSDNVYLKDQESIDENGLCEIKIKNNQIMNGNDRSDYLPEILNKLKGLNYYINDFESIGITYLDLCDKYNVKIGDTFYNCVMFNDEVEIKNGLNEIIYTDKPELSQTDYKKASESDKAERQTYLIVDKQAQRIDAVVSTQEEFNDSLSQLTIDVDGIQSKVELNYDFVREVEHTNNVSSEEMQKEGLIQLSIKGTAISSNYLRLNISNNTQAYVDLPITTILYQDEDTYDELSIENIYNEETGVYEYHTFITKKLDYIDNTIVQRSSSNNYLLDETTTPITTESSEHLLLDDFHLEKQDLGVLDLTIDNGEHTFSINGYNNLQYYLKYIIVNNITSDLVQSKHIISEINQSAEEIQINADKVSLNGKEINLTGDDIVIKSNNFNVDKEGNMICNNAIVNDVNIKSGHIQLQSTEDDEAIYLGTEGDQLSVRLSGDTIEGFGFTEIVEAGPQISRTFSLASHMDDFVHKPSGELILYDWDEHSSIMLNGDTGSIIGEYLEVNQIRAKDIYYQNLIQTSEEKMKKNFEKLENALNIVKDVDIYKYNFKFEENYDKKHIGFVIGDNFKYRKEITSKNNNGAEIYSMISVLWKAVQEQQEQIEELKKEIDILKGGK